MVPEERHPTARPWIGLSERSDQRIALIAAPFVRGRMEVGNQRARVPFGARGDRAAVGFDEIHHQEVRLGVMHFGDRKVRVARKLAEHVGLEREIGGATVVSRPRLDRQAPPIG
jgi:hypothetical protein